MMLGRGTLLLFTVIRQISRSHGSKDRQFWPKLGYGAGTSSVVCSRRAYISKSSWWRAPASPRKPPACRRCRNSPWWKWSMWPATRSDPVHHWKLDYPHFAAPGLRQDCPGLCIPQEAGPSHNTPRFGWIQPKRWHVQQIIAIPVSQIRWGWVLGPLRCSEWRLSEQNMACWRSTFGQQWNEVPVPLHSWYTTKQLFR